MLVSMKLLASSFLLVQGESTCSIFRHLKCVVNSGTQDAVGFCLLGLPVFSAYTVCVLDKIIFCVHGVSRVYTIRLVMFNP